MPETLDYVNENRDFFVLPMETLLVCNRRYYKHLKLL